LRSLFFQQVFLSRDVFDHTDQVACRDAAFSVFHTDRQGKGIENVDRAVAIGIGQRIRDMKRVSVYAAKSVLHP